VANDGSQAGSASKKTEPAACRSRTTEIRLLLLYIHAPHAGAHPYSVIISPVESKSITAPFDETHFICSVGAVPDGLGTCL